MTLFCVGSWVTATVAAGTGRRPDLLSAADAAPDPTATARAAPNTHADSGGPAPQNRAAVPGSAPRPVPILVRSRPVAIRSAAGSPPRAEGASLARLTGGAGRRAFPPSWGAAAGVGWTWDGASAPSPFSLRQPRADLVCPPTHRRGVARCATADGPSGRGRRPINPSGCRGCGPGHAPADW